MNDRVRGISRGGQIVLHQHAGSATTTPKEQQSTDGYDERLTKFRWQKNRHPRFNAKKSANTRWIKKDIDKNNGDGKAQNKGKAAQAGNSKAGQSNQQRLPIQPATSPAIPSLATFPARGARTWSSPVTTPFTDASAFNFFQEGGRQTVRQACI
jgi:hypothetical protein